MMECKHENVTGYMWRPRMIGRGQIMEWSYAFAQPGNADHHHRLVCDDCGAWLPLGPAAPHTEQTRIELRAAEIAVTDHDESGLSASEFVGWCVGNPLASHVALDGLPTTPSGYQAGYLARCIASHDKEQP
jgi:hypothetical protein